MIKVKSIEMCLILLMVILSKSVELTNNSKVFNYQITFQGSVPQNEKMMESFKLESFCTFI